MVTATITLLVFLGLAIAVPVGLWMLIDRETADEEVLDRRSAEQLARDEYDREQRGGRNRR